MALADSNPYLYFMISSEHIAKKNEVEAHLGRRFECGNVIVNGNKKKYSFVAPNKNFLSLYPDAKIVAEGYKTKINYTECGFSYKRGN